MGLKPVSFDANIVTLPDRLKSLRSLEAKLKSETNLEVYVNRVQPSEVWQLRVSATKPIDRAMLFGLSRALGFGDADWQFEEQLKLENE